MMNFLLEAAVDPVAFVAENRLKAFFPGAAVAENFLCD